MTTTQSSPTARRLSVPVAAVAGAVSAAVALAVGELVASLLSSPVSLVTAVGSEFVDRFAASLKDLAVALFGTNDKVALVVGIVVVSLILGAVIGVLDRAWRLAAPVGFGAFGVLGAWALASDVQGSLLVALVSAASAVGAGVGALSALRRAASRNTATAVIGPSSTGSATEDSRSPGRPGAVTLDRRSFALAVGGLIFVAGTGGLAARAMRAGGAVDASHRRTVLPRATSTTPVPAEQPFAVVGLSPYVTPTGDFYRIDTALSTPQVASDGWRLRITGMVDQPFELGYEDLLALDSVEAPVTIACVSNEVGGRLVGNAVWQGVPLASLLDRAGLRPEATQIVGRSVDGFTAGFPTAVALDGRTALVAYAMNGEPLPADHGHPARLIVSGLYGYVSATKWLEEIELTTWESFDGYWVPRGWSKVGPIKLQSRIDVPRADASLVAGPQPIAGVAWAPDTGVERVEVQIDDGPWRTARLGASASADTWVQWHLEWDADAGDHVISVRATDATGQTQTSELTDPAPDGATGWHTRRVRVT
jgi:DMSO/TMAO reductase YedYZ molybdopterin-dependent catalytic subunit